APTAVWPVEHGRDVADDLLIAQAPVIGLLQVSADVHAARDLGERRPETKQDHVGAGLQVEDSPGTALTPHRLFRGRVIEERRYRELLDAGAERLPEPVQDLTGVVDTGRERIPSAVELHDRRIMRVLLRQMATDRVKR